MRVLLIDDEKELVSTLAERLSFRGIEADWVCSGKEALGKIEDTFYDVAVVDIKMPQIGGIQLKRMIADKYPDMKFIFMTGHGSEEDFLAGSEEAGEEFYLVKPVAIEELIRKMQQVLTHRKQCDE